MESLTAERQEELRRDLTLLVEELEASIEASREDVRPVDLEQPIGRLSRMDALQLQSMALANRQAAEMRLKQAGTALRRIAENDYGQCMECEEPIGFARLKARPEAALCVACQGQREKRM